MTTEQQAKSQENKQKPPWQYSIIIKPLGFLYGSAGRFLSPENLVGRSGTSFPPTSATLSGIFAAQLRDNQEKLDQLQLAGPFFAHNDRLDNFYVPTPLNCLVKDEKIQHLMSWHEGKWQTKINDKWQIPPNDKFTTNTYLAMADWHKLLSSDEDKLPEVKTTPWKFVPHLHPKLRKDERRVLQEEEEGSLFLENGVQLNPDYCLVYLSNTEIDDGWYRFGGEGHIVELESHLLSPIARELFNQSLGCTFATITHAIWGSNRFSMRSPEKGEKGELQWDGRKVEALLTGRATPFRYRLGNRKTPEEEPPKSEQAKRLSRGRYAMPAGTVYVLDRPLNKTWFEWDENWFPKEGYSFKRWGCALSLPLAKNQ